MHRHLQHADRDVGHWLPLRRGSETSADSLRLVFEICEGLHVRVLPFTLMPLELPFRADVRRFRAQRHFLRGRGHPVVIHHGRAFGVSDQTRTHHLPVDFDLFPVDRENRNPPARNFCGFEHIRERHRLSGLSASSAIDRVGRNELSPHHPAAETLSLVGDDDPKRKFKQIVFPACFTVAQAYQRRRLLLNPVILRAEQHRIVCAVSLKRLRRAGIRVSALDIGS